MATQSTQTGKARCDRHPWGAPEGLTCTRTDPHTHGHVYASSTASDVDDRHTDGGHG